jgi:hypothetical protein
VSTLYTVLTETGCRPSVSVTFAVIQTHNQPLVIEFLVIVLIINKVVAVEVVKRPKRGASLTCLGLTNSPGI